MTMVEEFKVYGLPDWSRPLVRVLKLGSGVLMGGATAMHARIRDPLLKWVPATLFFLLSCYVVYAHAGSMNS